MDFLLKLIPNSWQDYAAAAAVCTALGWSIKKIPDLLAAKAIEYISLLFEKGGPAEDKLLVAHLVYAEEKFGPGTGAQKAAYLVEKIISLIPLPYRVIASSPKVRTKAQELLQTSFDRLENVFLAQIAAHKGVSADAVPPVPPQP